MQNFEEPGGLKNLVLNSLSSVEYEWLKPRLEAVQLRQGDVLYRVQEQITDAYFPTTCLLSLTNSTAQGEIVEVGITGKEGCAGVALLLGQPASPWRTEAQLAGQALKISSEHFTQAIDRFPQLRKRIAAFAYLKMVQLNQSSLCNRFHSVEERLCRWLLSAHDHTKNPKIALTRDILAEMIGSGRPAVSLTTGILQSAGLIRASRGEITILDRERMEESACECYQVVQQALNHYLAQTVS